MITPDQYRMEASSGVIRGNVDSLTELIKALEGAGVDFIGENVASYEGGRGVRLKSRSGERHDRASGPPPLAA
jgi:hypothetical protein